MFHINYTYQKGGPEYKCGYPDKKDRNHDIFIIKGRNDRGKSTLMQMIALGLYGESSEEISAPLKSKIVRLKSKKVDKCEFDFTVGSKDGKIKIESYLNNRKVRVKVNGKVRGSEYINDNFKILFDVPEESIKKLSSALSSIKEKLEIYENWASKYYNGVKEEIGKIEDYQDRENRIKEEKEELEDYKKSKNNVEDRLRVIKDKLSKLEKAHVVFNFEMLRQKITNIDDSIAGLEKKEKELKGKGVGGGNQTYKKRLKEFQTELHNLKIYFGTSDLVLKRIDSKNEKKFKTIQKQIDNIYLPSEFDNKKVGSYHKFINELYKLLKSKPVDKKKMGGVEQKKLLDRMISVLKDFIEINITIPGTGGKKITEFIDGLEKERDKLEEALQDTIEHEKAVELCADLISQLGKVVEAREKVPKVKGSDEEDYLEVVNKIKELNKSLLEKVREAEQLDEKYHSIPEKERKELTFEHDPEKVVRDYNNLKTEKYSLEKKLKDLEISISSKNDFIEELQRTKKPVKQSNLKKLRSNYEKTDSLNRKLSNFISHLGSLNLDKMEIEEEIDDESKKFYDALGIYFASSLKVIHFEDKSWALKKVDLLNRCYEVKGRNSIEFVDIGTGHTALNALMARLKQDYGGKKKILLFDEIGHMDQNNVNRLLNEIKNQVKNGEVIFAMLNQMDHSKENPVMEPIPY